MSLQEEHYYWISPKNNPLYTFIAKYTSYYDDEWDAHCFFACGSIEPLFVDSYVVLEDLGCKYITVGE